jgi:hypothetical protein
MLRMNVAIFLLAMYAYVVWTQGSFSFSDTEKEH